MSEISSVAPRLTAESPYLLGRDYRLTFYCIVFFTFILYIAPQQEYTFLRPLRLARTSAIIAVVAYLLQRRPLLDLDFETRCLLVIFLLSIISIPFSVWPGGSFDVLGDLYIKVIIIFLILSHVLTTTYRLSQMLWYILYFCIFLSIYTIDLFYARGFLPGTVRITGATSGITANPNDIALTLVLMVPVALSLYQLTTTRIRKLLSLGYVFTATVAIFITYSRAGFLSLVTIFLVFFYKELKKKAFKAVMIAAILFIVLVSFFPAGYSTRLASIYDPALDPTGTATSRKAAIYASFPIMMQNPIFGVGLGMSGIAMHARGLIWRPVHNVYLQFGTEVGIPAMILFIILLFRLTKSMHDIQVLTAGEEKDREINLLARALEASLIGFAVGGFFYPVSYHFYFYYPAGFSLALKKIYTATRPEPSLSMAAKGSP